MRTFLLKVTSPADDIKKLVKINFQTFILFKKKKKKTHFIKRFYTLQKLKLSSAQKKKFLNTSSQVNEYLKVILCQKY